MTKDEKIELFRQLYKLEQVGDKFMDSVPGSISAAFFDNDYVESIWTQNSLMRSLIFGKDKESIEWFLYEWKPGTEVQFEGATTIINTIDDYITWIVNTEGFGDSLFRVRAEAKLLLNAAAGLPKDVYNIGIDRAVDCIISAAILEMAVINQEAVRTMKDNP